MSSIVLDASVILAIVNAEPGHERFTPQLLTQAIVSTVNLAEAHSKLVAYGWNPDEAWSDARDLIEQAVPFDESQARITGDLIVETKHLGLSLGDRACLALGIASRSAVYTAERSWRSIKVGIPIHLIR